VWKARDLVESRDVALKIVDSVAVTQWGREAIEREARIAAKLSHPNVVALRNADWIDGRFVLATDLAVRSLAEYAPARRSARLGLGVIRSAAAGLAHAHSNRILHLDIKPENIMIFSDGRAALADFGTSRIAERATRTFTEAGTLGYIAPEQAYGRPRLASDVFSLGLVALELLVGRLPTWPFDWPPCEPGRFDRRVPEPVQRVLKKASVLDPNRRYPDAVALHSALDAAMNRITRQTQAVTKAPRPTHPAPPLRVVAADLFSRRHGRVLGMRYLCYRCEGAIAEEMSFCPWCGTGENSFREITSYPLVCPECERGVRQDWSTCPWCYRGRFDTKGRAYRQDPRAVRRCSKTGCPGRLRRFMRYCPVCKQKPLRPWSEPHLPDRCSRCRWPVSGEYWRFCPWCGRSRP
jgi:serine/threonine-protein kinase